MIMKLDSTTLFLFFLIACLGVALGALIQRIVSRRTAPPPIPPQEPILPPPAKVNQGRRNLRQKVTSKFCVSGKRDLVEFWLEMNGTRLNKRESLAPEQRNRLVNTLIDLRPWLDIAPVASASIVDKAEPVVNSIAPGKKGKPDNKEVKPPIVIKTIVQQIDEVLQAKLRTSSFVNRDIGLEEGPGGMVLVKDGLKKFEGIDAVPEPEIQVSDPSGCGRLGKSWTVNALEIFDITR